MSALHNLARPPTAPTPPATVNAMQEPRFMLPTIYVPDHVDIGSIQKCLEDRRSDFFPVNSTDFDAELELERRPYQQFLVLEREYFTLFSHDHPPVKFSYKSRNAVMSHLWRAKSFYDMSVTKFEEADEVWQLEQQPVLYFIDGNTISEYYESTATVDMAELAAVAQSKAALCTSHFFVVNRGKDYWAVDTSNSSINYTFRASTKTRTLFRLVDGSMTIQALIDEEYQLLSKASDVGTNQSPALRLYDVNGEELVEGERFALRLPGGLGEDGDDEEEENFKHERLSMFDGKGWVGVFNRSAFDTGREASVVGQMDYGDCFEIAVVDRVTYMTFDGQFVQIEDRDSNPFIVVLSTVPSKRNRIRISCSDNGSIALSRWGNQVPITYEWMKNCCRAFYIYTTDRIFDIRSSAKVRIVKV